MEEKGDVCIIHGHVQILLLPKIDVLVNIHVEIVTKRIGFTSTEITLGHPTSQLPTKETPHITPPPQ